MSDSMSLLYDALLGVHFLYSHGRIHGDLEPDNIGIWEGGGVLLDLGSSVYKPPGIHRVSGEEMKGAIGYSSSEHDMGPLDAAIDI